MKTFGEITAFAAVAAARAQRDDDTLDENFMAAKARKKTERY